MKRFFSFLLFVLLLAMTVAALQVWKIRREGGTVRSPLRGLFFGGKNGDGQRRTPERYTLAEGPRVDVNQVDVLAAMSRQRVTLAKAVVPSVVSITTSRSVRTPYNNDPLFYFFHGGTGRNGKGGEPATQKSLGSGVIVSSEGHIVTNNHVIEGMDAIEVELNDGRTAQARIIGLDTDTDIAVLKVDVGRVTPLPFGDSDLVEVGETVMAVGNPYGFQESVTQGMISAKNRHGSENTSDLFQTDAAINPGNSGGPLINVRGELIGINEAIYSESGGWQGVGFAIPSSTVRRIMDGILRVGRVIKGYLGVNLQGPLTPEVIQQQGLPNDKGALVEGVVANSPAEAANLQRGDFIRKFNGKDVSDFQELRRLVSEVDIDRTVPVELLRAGKELTVQVRIGEKPPEAQLAQQAHRRGLQQQPTFPFAVPPSLDGRRAATVNEGVLAGVSVNELDSPLGRHLRLPAGVKGVVVSGIDADCLAADKLQVGDIIEGINQKPVGSLEEYRRLGGGLARGNTAAVSILRGRERILVVLKAE